MNICCYSNMESSTKFTDPLETKKWVTLGLNVQTENDKSSNHFDRIKVTPTGLRSGDRQRDRIKRARDYASTNDYC